MTHHETKKELKKSIEELKRELSAIKTQLANSEGVRKAELQKRYDEFRKKYPLVFQVGEGEPEEPKPELPKDGRPQPEKGANKDAKTWRVSSMIQNPSLFKVIDNKGINVADQFHSRETAQQYIDYYVYEQGKNEGGSTGGTPSPAPEPSPESSSTTKDGVKVPYKIKGEWSYNFKKDARDGGARYNGPAAGLSLVMVGAFTASKDGGDEVSAKIGGGTHTDSKPYEGCIYDLGIKVNGKTPRMRCECPHPDYTGTLSTGTDGLTFVGRWTLMMASMIQETDGVRIRYYQDQGPAEDKPTNNWKKLYEFFDDGTKVKGIKGADRFPIRKLVATAQNTWRIDNTPGLDAKWLAIAEVDTS